VRTRWTLSLPILLAGWFLAGLSAAARADDQALVAKGEYLARAGDCIACHTNPGGALFAGGLAMATPFGTIYSSNIARSQNRHRLVDRR
jgi:alcohol dehydrogenase (quinone), cytochrome c subunit